MHILFISRGYPSQKRPQNGNFEVDQAEGLAKLGHTVSMISIDLGREILPKEYGVQRIEKNGVISYHIFLTPMKFFVGNGFFRKLLNCQLDFLYKKVVRELGKADIIYAHYLWNMDWGLFLKNKYHIPLIGIEHWSELGYEDIKPVIEQNAQRIYPQLDGLITVSHSLQKKIEDRFGIHSHVVYNTIHDSVRMSAFKKPKDDMVHFITVGSLFPVKGYDNLIKAMSQIALHKDNWELKIVGEGSEENNLRELISQLKLDKNVHLVGKKRKPEVVALLNQSDVFISSSHLETFGVAALEAMACGLPVIATKCGGPEEFVTENNGLLVPVDDVDALADAIKFMYKHYREYDRKAIADDCQALFSSEVIAQKLTQIFEDLINERGQ